MTGSGWRNEGMVDYRMVVAGGAINTVTALCRKGVVAVACLLESGNPPPTMNKRLRSVYHLIPSIYFLILKA